MKMRGNTGWLALGIGLALNLNLTVQAELIHRYSFNETSGTTVKDSVGTADGVLKGNGAALDGSENLVLPGGTSSAADPATISGYVDLPNHIINILTNLTIETWGVWNGSGAWQRVFDFGTSDGGEDVSNGNGNYLFMSPAGAANLRFAIRDPATGTEPVQLTSTAPLENGVEICLTVTYDYTANVCRLYSNAVVVATGPASVALKTINDVNNWLGRSQWGDPMYEGTYNEFRIYNNALNPLEVAASYNAGPQTPSTDPAALGAIQAVHLTVPRLTLTQYDKENASATVDFAKATALPLGGVAGVAYQSDNTNVVTVSASGEIVGVGPGTANVTLTYLGKTDSASITVKTREAGIAVAGTLYVDLRASDESPGTAAWANRAGKGDFSSVGTPVYESNVAGTGVAGVQFNGTTDAYLGPNTTSDLEGSHARSIEVWAYNPALASEETLVAWSYRGGNPDRSNMSFNYGANSSYGAVGQWGDDLGWNPNPPAGLWHYLAYTYDGINTIKVYVDGLLNNQKALAGPLASFASQPIRVGAQALAGGTDFDFGQAFSGDIALIRVHSGELSAGDITNNFLYGIQGSAPGSLQGINLRFDSASLLGVGAVGQSIVTATYANGNYFLVTGSATYSSSDTNMVTVDSTGTLRGMALGSATITASYQGQQATASIQVRSGPPAVLKHRWSFRDAASSTTVADSVGTANGTLMGGATLQNGEVVLNGTDGYVDLPNDLFTNYTNITFEAWVTDNASAAWARIYDFGNSSGGEDTSAGGTQYMFLSLPSGGGNNRLRGAYTITGGGAGEQIAEWGVSPYRPAVGRKSHIVWTSDGPTRTARLYVDGVQVGVNTNVTLTPAAMGSTLNDWLGRSQYADPYFNGSFDEFRVYDGALTPDDVKTTFGLGPDLLLGVNPGALLSMRIQATNSLLLGQFVPIKIVASFGSVSDVDVTSNPNLTLSTSDPGVIIINTNKQLEAVGVGTAQLVATYSGNSASNAVTVALAPGVPVKPVLIHRYSFNEAVGSTTVKDLVGTADGTLKGTGNFSGTGQLTLPGGAPGSDAGFVDLPNGIISSLTNATIEAWVNWNGGGIWQRIFDFGSNDAGEDQQGTGLTYFGMIPTASSGFLRFNVTTNSGAGENPVLDAPTALPTNALTHVALSYNPVAGAVRMYMNGVRVGMAAGVIPLSGIIDVNNWLGKSNWGDPFFNGSFDEFRIYSGAMLDADVAADYAAGPNALPGIGGPRLGATRQGATIVLTWPVDPAGFALESSPALGTQAVWTAVSGAPVVANGQNTLTLDISGTKVFYRLKK